MPTSALLLALGAAFVHALWNVLLARARDPRAATAVALLVAEVVFAIPAWAAWNVHAAVWPFLVASGALQLAYFTLLVTAYRAGAAVGRLSDRAGHARPCSCSSSASSRSAAGPRSARCSASASSRRGSCSSAACGRTVGRGVAFGLVIACIIAVYTLVDKHGVTHAGALPYLELSMLGPALVYAATVPRGAPSRPSCIPRPSSPASRPSAPTAWCCSRCSARRPLRWRRSARRASS